MTSTLTPLVVGASLIFFVAALMGFATYQSPEALGCLLAGLALAELVRTEQ